MRVLHAFPLGCSDIQPVRVEGKPLHQAVTFPAPIVVVVLIPFGQLGDGPALLLPLLLRCVGHRGGRWAEGCAYFCAHAQGEQPVAVLIVLAGLHFLMQLPVEDREDD